MFYRVWFYGGTWLQIGLILVGGHLKYSLLLFACWLSVVLFMRYQERENAHG